MGSQVTSCVAFLDFDVTVLPLLLFTQKSIHWIRNLQVSLNNMAVENSSKVAFCACWCATLSVCKVNDTRAHIGLCLLVTSH